MAEPVFTSAPYSVYAQGEANEYCILDGKRWVLAFRLNGEIRTPEQENLARLFASAPKLLQSVEKLSKVLESHILDESRNKNIRPETLCPCWTTELKEAGELIQSLKGNA